MTDLVTVLVGPPCVGKSTYLKEFDYDFVISSDDIVEILTSREGLQYHEFFTFPSNSHIKKEHNNIFNQLVKESKKYTHVVWDLTNLTKKSRKRIFTHYPQAIFNAVVFEINNNIFDRNKARYKTHGKWIDEQIINKMLASYQPIEHSEGFSEVTLIEITK